VKDIDIPVKGRVVQCGYCSVSWHQMPVLKQTKNVEELITIKKTQETDDSPSVDSIKASNGKTYKFLGSQWVELLPSGKTGLFARKNISRELDEVTGRKERKIIRKKQKKQKKQGEVDPSESTNVDKKLPDIYKPKQSLGFFGYIFLIIIIGFSVVGILKTFEDDLLNYFPELEYVYELFNEQIEYLAETVKNIIVIINDLIDSY
jgi:hypothetical protein